MDAVNNRQASALVANLDLLWNLGEFKSLFTRKQQLTKAHNLKVVGSNPTPATNF